VLNALRQSEENHSDPAHFRKSEHLVLNALRQSEENHSNIVVNSNGGDKSAQRLTAIRGKSRNFFYLTIPRH